MRNQREKIAIISELAFKAVDEDESNSLEHNELAQTIKDAAIHNRVKQPTEQDIDMIVREIDEDDSGVIDSEEFTQMILNVFDKLVQNEQDLIDKIDC